MTNELLKLAANLPAGVTAVGSGALLGDWSIFITVLQIILLVIIAIVMSGLGCMTLLLVWHRLFCGDDERANGNGERNNGEGERQPSNNALALEVSQPSSGVEFQCVGGTLDARKRSLYLALAHLIRQIRVLMVALGKEQASQNAVYNAHSSKSPNEKS